MIRSTGLGTPFTAAAVVIILASNFVQLQQGHTELETVLANQANSFADGAKVDRQLDALAKGTQQLAQAGDPNAQRIVAILRAKGINIKNN
ncbi:MAG: hypothetical protein ACRYG4_22370 [Janthinobacterium lividum]